MSLRNKIAILSITLMSLMTIPTLAENDNQPVTSRIENAKFDVQIKTPEGWSETKDFTSIPETFTVGGQVYRGLQFKNGTELHGCAIFFTEDSFDDDDEDDNKDVAKTLTKAQEMAFPGSAFTKLTISKITVDGSFAADVEKETAKANLKGTIEGSVASETGDPTNLTITGSVQADTTKGSLAIGTGSVVLEGATPISGTTGLLFADDYKVLVAIWGTNEESQVRDTYRFLEAVAIEAKAPAETSVEVVSINDIVVVSEIVEVTSNAIVVTESVAVVEVVESAPVTTET